MKDKIRGANLFKWEILNWAQNLSEHPKIEDVYEKRLTGMLIENVLSQQQIDTVLQSLTTNAPNDFKVFREEVTIYPRGFAAYLDNTKESLDTDLNIYFENGFDFWSGFEDRMKVDLSGVIESVFNKLSDRHHYKILPGYNDVGVFPPFQFRSFHPNQQGLIVHNGNVFQKMYEKFYALLETEVSVKNQMSFFIMLQKPEIGGELTLYDVPWSEKQSMSPPNSIIKENGEDWNIVDDENVKKMVIDPEPGDMIIFMGGDVWHSVQAFKGDKDRVTVGGFFAYTKDGKHLISWC